jgi:hypothetical protein
MLFSTSKAEQLPLTIDSTIDLYQPTKYSIMKSAKIKNFVISMIAIFGSNFPVNMGILAVTLSIVPSIIAAQPASAAWYDNITGVYIDWYGSKYYYGSFVQDPNPKFQGSTWELMCGSDVCAHGYNRSIPRAVQWLAQRFGQ